MNRLHLLVAACLLPVACLSPLGDLRADGPVFGAPQTLNSNSDNTIADDYPVRLAADGDGTVVAAWSSSGWFGGGLGLDNDILFSRSVDGGATWSSAAPIASDAGSDSAYDGDPALAVDGQGRWVAVWGRQEVAGGAITIWAARSSDGGATWSEAAAAFSGDGGGAAGENGVALAAAGDTTLALWREPVVDPRFGERGTGAHADRFMFARTGDGGATWTPRAPLHGEAVALNARQAVPALSGDGDGKWIFSWTASAVDDGAMVTEVFHSRSEDDGTTWSAPAFFHPLAEVDEFQEAATAMVAVGAGAWIAAWNRLDLDAGAGGDESSIYLSRSLDHGASWSEPAPFYPVGGAAAQDRFRFPSLALGASGDLMASWTWLETSSSDQKILGAISTDGGMSWSPPQPLDHDDPEDDGRELYPIVVAAGDAWLVAWNSNENPGDSGIDFDILYVHGVVSATNQALLFR
jgi:hypothetical protein